MPLHLKRTPAEEHERARRKAYKAAKKAAKRKRAKHVDDSPFEPDYDAIRAELEEMEFREKMWGALEDDERLGGIDARLNDYPHIPDRWSRGAHEAADPQYMDDEEYAEWIRQGMWRKQHAREHEEQAKRDAERAAQKAREKQLKVETFRMEKLAREQEERRRKERQRQKEEEQRQQYEQRWKGLLDPRARDQSPLTTADIPWPLFQARHALRVEDITPEAITSFLFPEADPNTTAKDDNITRRHRDKLKETLLRFHPDKFEGRFMHRVSPSDIEALKEVVGQVAIVLNTLMSGTF